MKAPSPSKLLNFIREVLGIIFLSSGLILLFVNMDIINQYLQSPLKEILGYFFAIAGSYLLFKSFI